ncbi:MAG: type II secretion system F family protein [Methanobrevibacter sp.]|nr:type II secretion system F family protein [Methanobrevibacter sp.]
MFSRFFVAVGGMFVAVIEFFRTFTLTDSETESKIFSRLKIQKESRNPLQDETKLDMLRDKLLDYLFNRAVVLSIFIVLIVLAGFVGVEIGGIFLIGTAMIYIYILYYPQIKDDRSYSDLNRELPYALRHMSIELKSGKGLHDSMLTIRNADYGSLSREFNRVLEEVKFGSTLEDSLIEMVHRVNSEGLSRSVHQIIGTLRVGGNLSSSLEIIAKDISFDMQIKLKDYSQKLNSFILIYTFIAILAPVITLIMLMASSTVMGDIISTELLFVIYVIFFPMVVLFMGVFIKKLEPKI